MIKMNTEHDKVNWRALRKNVLTHILGFFNLCSKVVDFLHVTQHYCIIYVNFWKKWSQKYCRTLIWLIMLGHMQKVSHFWAQMRKNAKCQLGRFCPEPFNYLGKIIFTNLINYCWDRLQQIAMRFLFHQCFDSLSCHFAHFWVMSMPVLTWKKHSTPLFNWSFAGHPFSIRNRMMATAPINPLSRFVIYVVGIAIAVYEPCIATTMSSVVKYLIGNNLYLVCLFFNYLWFNNSQRFLSCRDDHWLASFTFLCWCINSTFLLWSSDFCTFLFNSSRSSSCYFRWWGSHSGA